MVTLQYEQRFITVEILYYKYLILQGVEWISFCLLYFKKVYQVTIASYCIVIEYFKAAIDSFFELYPKHFLEVVLRKKFDQF